jgi:hypothetical protein
MIRTLIMSRYVKTCLFTIHSFTDAGPTTGTSNTGCHLGMRTGQNQPFPRKESLCTSNFFRNRISVLGTQAENYSFHSSRVRILFGVTVNFRTSGYENIRKYSLTVLLPHREPSCSKFTLDLRTFLTS